MLIVFVVTYKFQQPPPFSPFIQYFVSSVTKQYETMYWKRSPTICCSVHARLMGGDNEPGWARVLLSMFFFYTFVWSTTTLTSSLACSCAVHARNHWKCSTLHLHINACGGPFETVPTGSHFCTPQFSGNSFTNRQPKWKFCIFTQKNIL